MSKWIECAGSEPKLPSDVRVHVILSNGREADWDPSGMRPELFDWSDKGRPFVTHYKVMWPIQGDPNAPSSGTIHSQVVEEYVNDTMREAVEANRRRAEIRAEMGGLKAAWSGEGLPPVGTVVWFARHIEEDGPTWDVAKVVGYDTHAAVVSIEGGGYAASMNHWDFSPIRTDEEKAVEEAMQAIGAEAGDYVDIKGVVERMLAAGYRKTDGV